MNKVQQINLGGIPFTIDEDAYEHLSRYLKAIHRHFSASEGYEEITNDIESRMAELFDEQLAGRPIVSRQIVEDAIIIMGTPEDFGAEAIIDEPMAGTTQRERPDGYQTGKRLFRHPDDEVIGGVCAGIAAYFGIADPLWVRLTFIIITVLGGFGIPAYLILWAIVPRAETAGDRLAMRGEPINASNIGRIVEEEFDHISQKVSEFSEELTGKKKGRETGRGNGLSRFLRRFISLIGQMIRVVLDVLARLWKPLLIALAAFLAIVAAITWIAGTFSLVFAWPVFQFFAPEPPILTALSITNIMIVVGLLLFSLVLMVVRLLYGTRMGRNWRLGLTGLWIINVISLFFVGALTARDFSHGNKQAISSDIGYISSDTLYLSMEDRLYDAGLTSAYGDFQILDDDLLAKDMVRIYLEQSDGDRFELALEASAQGSNSSLAAQRAAAVEYDIWVEGDKLILPQQIRIKKGQKWRAQEVYATLKVPVGKTIFLDESVSWKINRADKADENIMIYKNPNQAWTMTEQGLSCATCTLEGGDDASRNTYEPFDELYLEGPMKVTIQEGAGYWAELSGNEEGRQQVQLERIGSTFRAITDWHGGSPVRLLINLPELSKVRTEATDDLWINGFSSGRMEIDIRDGGELKADLQVDSLFLTQEGQKVDLRGRYEHISAQLSNKARLDAEKAEVASASIRARNDCRIDLGKVPVVLQDVDESSDLDLNQ